MSAFGLQGPEPDWHLFAVITKAFLQGVLTRYVNDLVKALGAGTLMFESQVSRFCSDMDAEVALFRDWSLAATRYPCRFSDATYWVTSPLVVGFRH